MKLLIIAVSLLLASISQAETLAQFKARLLSEGTVERIGIIVDEEAPVIIEDENGTAQLIIAKLQVVVVSNEYGHENWTKMRVHLYDYNTVNESVKQADNVRNYSTPNRTPSEQVARGRSAIRELIATATPIPAAPTEQLPIVVTEPSWVGQIITKYTWPLGSKIDDGAVMSAEVNLYLNTSGKTTVKISVDPDTDNFIVEPAE